MAATAESIQSGGLELRPRQIVDYLDRYIVGQQDAKRAVAIAIRNRWRRLQLGEKEREEVTPKNILMIGPTGVGKTEIARRLARLLKAPFLKVEATKFTEVGYVGRDVESIIRDLVEVAMAIVREEEARKVEELAAQRAEERLIDALLSGDSDDLESEGMAVPTSSGARERMRELLRSGVLDDRRVRLRVKGTGVGGVHVFPLAGMEQIELDIQRVLSRVLPKQTQVREVTVRQAREILLEEEREKLLDEDKIAEEAVRRTEETGIVFLDELDKICATGRGGHGPDVSREGVQRDLLPIVEGTTVNTRYGPVRTDHILFVGAGAFHHAKPSDLMPELQGRFPIRVELKALTRDDFLRILKEPESSIIRQYQMLLATEGVELEFTEDALETIADIAFQVNQTSQNIGARRLHTVVERVLEDVSFDAPDLKGQTVTINAAYVRRKLEDIVKQEDLSRYVL